MKGPTVACAVCGAAGQDEACLCGSGLLLTSCGLCRLDGASCHCVRVFRLCQAAGVGYRQGGYGRGIHCGNPGLDAEGNVSVWP